MRSPPITPATGLVEAWARRRRSPLGTRRLLERDRLGVEALTFGVLAVAWSWRTQAHSASGPSEIPDNILALDLTKDIGRIKGADPVSPCCSRNDGVEPEFWRHQSHALRRPLQHLDRIIGALEHLHLEDKTDVPDSLLPELSALVEELPSNLQPTHGWPSRIRDVIAQCFDLQEQLLRLENPHRAEPAGLEEAGPGHEPAP